MEAGGAPPCRRTLTHQRTAAHSHTCSDPQVLAYVRRIMARYRRGEYVSEDELEFAFQQLEKRFLL